MVLTGVCGSSQCGTRGFPGLTAHPHLLPPEAWQQDRRVTKSLMEEHFRTRKCLASTVKMLPFKSSLIFGKNNTSASEAFDANSNKIVVWELGSLGLDQCFRERKRLAATMKKTWITPITLPSTCNFTIEAPSFVHLLPDDDRTSRAGQDSPSDRSTACCTKR